MSARSYAEFKKRIHLFAQGTVPCPDCALALPAGGDDTDYQARQRHYAVCPGKPPTAVVKASVLIQPLDCRDVSTSALCALQMKMRAKLALAHNGEPLVGLAKTLHTAYVQILDSVDAELASRRGA
jgi:hypothetical protein